MAVWPLVSKHSLLLFRGKPETFVKFHLCYTSLCLASHFLFKLPYSPTIGTDVLEFPGMVLSIILAALENSSVC